MTGTDIIRKADIFEGLVEEQLAFLWEGIRELGYRRGDRFFKEGDEARHLWIVKEGEVDLGFELPGRSASEVYALSTVSAGKAFGWSSFVPPYEYRLSGYCSSATCAVFRLEREFLLGCFEKDPAIGYKVMANLACVVGERFNWLQGSASVAPYAQVKITVHLATCGIAAGAREVVNALVEEMAKEDRPHIKMQTSGCIGRCSTEPNVTVQIEGEEPVIYQKMNGEKMRRVFREHVLNGVAHSDWVLA
ncbi:MAG: cyclic nucleotide-binding domain-containing protein [Deltaproteobacteria bacterium]|nr:cyclic nucleotide-binding domain-containing protein [Deltaproteobacteria bacterium]